MVEAGKAACLEVHGGEFLTVLLICFIHFELLLSLLTAGSDGRHEKMM